VIFMKNTQKNLNLFSFHPKNYCHCLASTGVPWMTE